MKKLIESLMIEGNERGDSVVPRVRGAPMDVFRPSFVRLLGLLGWILGSVGCSTYAHLTPERVERVPAGQYHVVISENRGGRQGYSAVLFNRETRAVTLDLPTVEAGNAATPDDYAAVQQAGFVVYAVRGASGTVLAYLMVPAQARVMVWSRPERQGGAVVTVTDRPSAPEAAGGGGGGGGGAGGM
jgi:hypothetical protein